MKKIDILILIRKRFFYKNVYILYHKKIYTFEEKKRKYISFLNLFLILSKP